MNTMFWFQQIRERVEKLAYAYAHYLPTVALLWGLFWDTLTLRRPDNPFENAVVIAYLLLSAGVIVILNMRHSRGGGDPSLLMLGFLQFAFGNLTSALIILYAKSGTFVGSAIFFAVFGALLVGNEFVRNRYSRIYVHVAVWYLLVLSYFTIVIPILFGRIGDIMFAVSVAASLSAVAVLIAVLSVVSAREIISRVWHIVASVVAVVFLMSTLYLTGNIPPAPLMLKHIGIYHSLARTNDGNYRATYESPHWYQFFLDTANRYKHTQGTSAYCASAVFAPPRLNAPIFYRWEYYDPDKEEWVTTLHIPFSIIGGRDGGYRGYSQSFSLKPGLWRCNVETERGALIGRFSFDVVLGTPRILEEVVL